MGDNEHEQEKVCGFDKEPCIKEKCVHWTEIAVARPGMFAPQKEGMCVFHALLLVTGSPKPQMQQIPLNQFAK
ncbi:unnamed protein product, partial [marine sediment metagenome]